MEGNGSTGLCSFIAVLSFLLACLSFTGPEPCSASRVDPPTMKSSTEFIRAHCGATKYPDLCFKSLASHATVIQSSPTQLADAALSVSLSGAQAASSDVSRLSAGARMPPPAAEAVADCMESLADSVDALRKSLRAMEKLRGKKSVRLEINDVQTWVSTALTDENACMDELAGGNGPMSTVAAGEGGVREMVRSRVVNVAQLTSNALALVAALAAVAP